MTLQSSEYYTKHDNFYPVHHIQMTDNTWENMYHTDVFSLRLSLWLCCPTLCCRLTDEVRELFAGMGSRMVYSVKHRDNWMFAGARGLNKENSFEKVWTSKDQMFEAFL